MRIASRCELVLILLSIKMIRLAIVAFLSFIGIIPSTPAEKNPDKLMLGDTDLNHCCRQVRRMTTNLLP